MIKKCICRELGLSNPIEFYGHFVFTSLDAGEGLTLGNMIRRTLISKLSGSKIVGVKLSNINNEFSEIGGVREDMLEVFLNLKEVIIKNPLNSNVCYGKLKITGPAVVTAGLIDLPNDINILNPEHYLFTISEQIIIDLEVKIEHGKSYTLATDRKLDNLGEFLPLDANFTPILKVEYFIQPVVEFTDKSTEELHLIISTNGTLLPQEALLLAANQLSNLILSCRNIEFLHLQEKSSSNLGTNEINTESQIFDNILEEKNNKNKTIDNFSLSKSTANSLIQKIETKNQRNSYIDTKNNLKLRSHKLAKNIKSDKVSVNHQLDVPAIKTLSKKVDNSLILQNHKKKYKEEETNVSILKTSTKPIDLRTIDIEITCLPNRIITTLRKAKINMMSDLLNSSSEDLQKIKGLGPVSILRIKTQINLFFEAISL